MTALTPMIMPSIVRAVRILFRPSAFKAIRKIIRTPMETPCRRLSYYRRFRERRELVPRLAPLGHRAIGDDLAVAELHDARAVLGDVVFVSDQQHGNAAL